jgi:hypothetical protein
VLRHVVSGNLWDRFGRPAHGNLDPVHHRLTSILYPRSPTFCFAPRRSTGIAR